MIGQALSSAAATVTAADSSGTAAAAAAALAARQRQFSAGLSQCWRLPAGETRARRLEMLLAAGLGDALVSVPSVRLQLVAMSHGSYSASADDLLPTSPPQTPLASPPSAAAAALKAEAATAAAPASAVVYAAATTYAAATEGQEGQRQLATGPPLNVSVQLMNGLGMPYTSGAHVGSD